LVESGYIFLIPQKSLSFYLLPKTLIQEPKENSQQVSIFKKNQFKKKGGSMHPVPEIRREKIFIAPEMTTKEIKKEYALNSRRAAEAKRKGFFVKNYSKKQIIIDPENFDPAISYSTAKRVYWKNFA
jgi:hypothetical protein